MDLRSLRAGAMFASFMLAVGCGADETPAQDGGNVDAGGTTSSTTAGAADGAVEDAGREPCADVECGSDAECDEATGECVCVAGAQDNDGDGVCSASCEAVDCDAGFTCDDATGTARCVCEAGTQDNDGNGECAADCESTRCGANASCDDSTGTATCACDEGYQDNDDNGDCSAECTASTCGTNASCDDSTGTATCSCDEGYQDEDGDDNCSLNCANTTCGANASCDDSTGTATCSCDEGYQDNDGDEDCSANCATTSCGQGTCDDSTGEAVCSCSTGFAPPACDTCAVGYTDGVGSCDACAAGFEDTGSGSVLCETCAAGYYGPTCLLCPTCENGGSCRDGIEGDGGCDCAGNYGGVLCTGCAVGYTNFADGCNDCDDGYQDLDGNGSCEPECGGGDCDGLDAARGLATGVHDFTLRSGSVPLYVDGDYDGGSWVLVGRGREGWAWTEAGLGDYDTIKDGLGTTAAFTPNYLPAALIQGLIDNIPGGADLGQLEIRLKRAAATNGSSYQNVLWTHASRAQWTWLFDGGDGQGGNLGMTVDYQFTASALGATEPAYRTDTEDTEPPSTNDAYRVFTWPWVDHANLHGFSYGSTVSGAGSPLSFMWESGSENHAIPYTEVYVRVQGCESPAAYCGPNATSCDDSAGLPACDCADGYDGDVCNVCAAGYQDNDINGSCLPACDVDSCAAEQVCTDAAGQVECLSVGGTSCAEVLANDASATDGFYLIDPDGTDPQLPLFVYCDMTTDDGGWMLAAKVTDDFGWVNTDNYGNLWTTHTERTGFDLSFEAGAAGGAHLPNAVVRQVFSEGNKQVRFSFYWEDALSEDGVATFTNDPGLFDDSVIGWATKDTDYTWSILQHDRSAELSFDAGIICWGNQNGEDFRVYEHGLFMGLSAGGDAPCHLQNSATSVQWKSHYANENGTAWFRQDVCGDGTWRLGLLGSCRSSPTHAESSQQYVWVR